jgi:hypothetical protein
MKYITFERDDHKNWFVALPDYPGPKSDLLMVAGTDKILDELAGENDSILLKVSDIPFKGSLHLTKNN